MVEGSRSPGSAVWIRAKSFAAAGSDLWLNSSDNSDSTSKRRSCMALPLKRYGTTSLGSCLDPTFVGGAPEISAILSVSPVIWSSLYPNSRSRYRSPLPALHPLATGSGPTRRATDSPNRLRPKALTEWDQTRHGRTKVELVFTAESVKRLVGLLDSVGRSRGGQDLFG